MKENNESEWIVVRNKKNKKKNNKNKSNKNIQNQQQVITNIAGVLLFVIVNFQYVIMLYYLLLCISNVSLHNITVFLVLLLVIMYSQCVITCYYVFLMCCYLLLLYS